MLDGELLVPAILQHWAAFANHQYREFVEVVQRLLKRALPGGLLLRFGCHDHGRKPTGCQVHRHLAMRSKRLGRMPQSRKQKFRAITDADTVAYGELVRFRYAQAAENRTYRPELRLSGLKHHHRPRARFPGGQPFRCESLARSRSVVAELAGHQQTRRGADSHIVNNRSGGRISHRSNGPRMVRTGGQLHLQVICALLRGGFGPAHLHIRKARPLGPAQDRTRTRRRAQHPRPIVRRHSLFGGLAAELFERRKYRPKSYLQQRRMLIAYADVFFYSRQEAGQCHLNGVGAGGKRCRGKAPSAIRQQIQRFSAGLLLGGDQHRGAHLRCAFSVDHHTRNPALILGVRDRQGEDTPQRNQAKNANRSQMHRLHLPCGAWAFAAADFTVKSANGVIVCFARLSVTATSSLYFPGGSDPRVILFSKVSSSPCSGSLFGGTSNFNTGSASFSLSTRNCTEASGLCVLSSTFRL